MQEYIEAAILGVIQGLTEFLPVSSSGHLEIAKYWFGENQIAELSLQLTIVLHFATALSTILVFRKEVAQLVQGFFSSTDLDSKWYIWWIVISLVPAAVVGIGAEEFITSLFTDNLSLVSICLIVTAGLLYLANRVSQSSKPMDGWKSFIIGIAQAIAILPGISRSGATISTALLLGVEREKAAQFSFLMVIPLIFGKILLDLLSGDFSTGGSQNGELIIGFIAAFISGYFACTWMLAVVKKAKLWWFALYCLGIGIIGLLYVGFRG